MSEVAKAQEFINYHQDYDTKVESLFLGNRLGLVENLRNNFPKVFELYKHLKSLDWDENEIDISSCRTEFKETDPQIVDLMIKTLSFQFEADSSAAHIPELMYPFVNNTELAAYVTEVGKNEILHSLAYKSIVENSFDDPTEFLKTLVEIEESFCRLDKVGKVFAEIFELGAKYNLGLEKDEALIRKAILKFWVTLLCLERIQFMSSFAITFGLAEAGHFIPIATLVQKIATDEFQVHVQGDKIVLENELAIESNFGLFLEVQDELRDVIKEVVDSELVWTDFLFSHSDQIAGIRKDMVKEFVLYSATDVYNFLKIDNPYTVIRTNPLPYMNKWLKIDATQASPQEQSVSNYLLGNFVDDRDKANANSVQLTFE